MPGDIHEPLTERYERNGWPAQIRPDVKPPEGWSLSLVVAHQYLHNHALSPDGARIAFIWDQEAGSNIHVMPSAGGWPRQLSTDRPLGNFWEDSLPRWSPDGGHIAYTQEGHVHVIPSGGGPSKSLSRRWTGAGDPHWLPDGRLLMTFDDEDHQRILLTDRDGAWPRQISHGPGHDADPNPSPDSGRVAYTHYPKDDFNRSDIMRVDLETGHAVPLTSTPGFHNRSPRWSPDGAQIAFISERTGNNEVFLVRPDGEGERQLTHLDADVGWIAWSLDGSRLAATLNREGAWEIGLIDAQTGAFHTLRARLGTHQSPQWSPDGAFLTFEYEGPTETPDIYRMAVDSGEVTRLTDSTPLGLTAVELVTPEHVRYTSFDDLSIPALLYPPPKPNGAAIVYPHGGPTGQYGYEWDVWVQYLVAKGYTVLAPNFRGSTGYGLDFERANHGVWGIDDTRDCLAGADFLATLDWVKKERIAIYGASYGAYMVYCSLAQDPEHRFACGVARFGDCDILSSWAQGDLAGREDLERMMKHPSQNLASYIAGSPVWHVADIEKPLLILHGLEDRRVHPLQSEELVEALKREDKTFEYKTYTNEAHGFLHRANRLDAYARVERFFDWWLM
jgi:dipeptidyl aminopeptidase/acylaminoacyl peptidase